jgi:hypothetical protein
MPETTINGLKKKWEAKKTSVLAMRTIQQVHACDFYLLFIVIDFNGQMEENMRTVPLKRLLVLR